MNVILPPNCGELNMQKSSSRVGASAVFTFAPMPEKMPKRFPKATPRDPKVDQNSNKTVFNKKPEIDTDSLSWF